MVKKNLSLLVFIGIGLMWLAFMVVNKTVGWSWLEKELPYHYSELDYQTAELRQAWDAQPLDSKGDFVFQQIEFYLADTLTDPEEFYISSLFGWMVESKAPVARLEQQLFAKPQGSDSLFQQLINRVDEESHAWDEKKAQEKVNNKIYFSKLVGALFRNPQRSSNFIEQAIIQIGENYNEGQFSFQDEEVNLALQTDLRRLLFSFLTDPTTLAPYQYTREELLTCERVFKFVRYDYRRIERFQEVRAYIKDRLENSAD